MHRTRIKICGITTPEAAWCAVEAGADALGFVFVRSSARYIDPERAWEIASVLPPFVAIVGLFVDPSLDDYDEVREEFPCDYAQLHGSEPEPLVRDCGPDVIKAVRFDPATIEHELLRWSRVADVGAILVDGSAGGGGVAFDWAALARVRDASDHPLIVAGGLDATNVGGAIRAVRPFAVDVSSGVESAPGEKDPRKIAAFCRAVREADLSIGA